MRRSALLLGLILMMAFSGCFSDTENEILLDGEDVPLVQIENIMISQPIGWDVVERDQDPVRIEQGVVMILRSPEPWGLGDTFATVTVAREEVPAGTSAKKYADAGVLDTSRTIVRYQEIEKTLLETGQYVGQLLHFTGKNDFESEELEWWHLFTVQGDTGYVVSGASPRDATEDQKGLLEDIVRSFSFAESNG